MSTHIASANIGQAIRFLPFDAVFAWSYVFIPSIDWQHCEWLWV